MSSADNTASFAEGGQNDFQQAPMPRYTEVGQDGQVLYQSDSVPVELAAAYLQPRSTVAQRNAAMTGEKTSDQYRTFDVPSKFDNPGSHVTCLFDLSHSRCVVMFI
jgi:hypothetical protein